MKCYNKSCCLPQVAFCAVDCTQEKGTCSTHDVSGYPTFKYFNYGKNSQKYMGGREVRICCIKSGNFSKVNLKLNIKYIIIHHALLYTYSVHHVLYLYFCRRQISLSLWRIHSTLSRSPASLQHPARRSIGMMWPGTRTLTS